MTVSGLTVTPSRCCLRVHAPSYGLLNRGIAHFSCAVTPTKTTAVLRLGRSHYAGSSQIGKIKTSHLINCAAADASFGDMTNEPSGAASVVRQLLLQVANERAVVWTLVVLTTVIFPRINVKDPYKRLGISREASEDEIQAARNFLIRQYAGHKPSVDAIESAHDKIIMQKFYDRRNPKIDIKKKVREVNQSRFVQAVRSRFQTPSTKFIMKTSAAFIVLAFLTVLFPTEEGPTLQVAISLLATLYFIHDRLKSKLRAFLYSAGAFIFSWLLGTFLMVSLVPPIPVLKGLRSFEVTTSLITYLLLWVSSTYLK